MDYVNCDPDQGMVDLDRCPKPKASPQYDPFADKKITCREMKRYPDLIFTGSIDLGSGVGSPIEVDYTCKESLAALPFLQRLDRLTDDIRGDRGPQICTGSIVHALWRYHQFALLEAGFAPRKLPERDARRLQADSLYPQKVDENFERWSYESLSNFELHKTFRAEIAKVMPLLTRHYLRTFGYSRDTAVDLASRAITIYVRRAADDLPRGSPGEPARVLAIARHVSGSLGELQSVLDDSLGEGDVRTGLNIALLLRRPSTHIALLADRAGSLDSGEESPLFFALRQHQDVRCLLDHGAGINYQNQFGKTVLFDAIGFTDHRLVELMLERGADLNHRYLPRKEDVECANYLERTSRTPLMHAARHADVPVLKILVQRGARLQDVDGSGYNATAYALEADRGANSAYLKSLGLLAPAVEKELASQKRFAACSNEAQRRRLVGKDLSQFLASCDRPERPN